MLDTQEIYKDENSVRATTSRDTQQESSPPRLPPSTPGRDKKKGGDNHPHTYRTIFISDTHLGTKTAATDMLLDFLKNVRCEKLYLVGDIIDGWRLQKSWYWDTLHNDILRRVLKMAKAGVDVIYIPGNHDEGLRPFTGFDLAGVSTASEAIHTAADGKTYWVLHGDQFDGVIQFAKWLAFLGDWAYGLLLQINRAFNWVRGLLGYRYWSLSAFLKHKVKNAVEYIGKFEETVAREAKKRGVDGVICGHIHHAEIRDIDGITYMNDGDWVESCTALGEREDGSFELINWSDVVAARDPQSWPYTKKKRKRKKKAKLPENQTEPQVNEPQIEAAE